MTWNCRYGRIPCRFLFIRRSHFCSLSVRLQREELLASRKRRSEQLEKLLVEVKQRLADHNNGDRILIDEEKASLEKKADIYQRKLDTMKEVPDEREIQRMLEKERLIKERARIRQQRNEL